MEVRVSFGVIGRATVKKLIILPQLPWLIAKSVLHFLWFWMKLVLLVVVIVFMSDVGYRCWLFVESFTYFWLHDNLNANWLLDTRVVLMDEWLPIFKCVLLTSDVMVSNVIRVKLAITSDIWHFHYILFALFDFVVLYYVSWLKWVQTLKSRGHIHHVPVASVILKMHGRAYVWRWQ